MADVGDPEQLMSAVIPEMDNFLAYQEKLQARQQAGDSEEPDPENEKYAHPEAFQIYLEDFFGEDIWPVVLDAMEKQPTYEKYLKCVPAEHAFNRNGLESFNATVYDHLHSVVERRLGRVVEGVVQKFFVEARSGWEFTTTDYPAEKLQDRGKNAHMLQVGAMVPDGKGGVTRKIIPRVSIMREHDGDKAAFYKIGGLFKTPKGMPNKGLSFWLTFLQPTGKGHSHHGGVNCRMIDSLADCRPANTILGEGNHFGHISSIDSILQCAELAVHDALVLNREAIFKYAAR